MDIKEFVSQTIKQIIDSVLELQTQTHDTNAVVVPYGDSRRNIEFDIAVTVVESTETGGKAGISVFSVGAGITGKTGSSSSTVSRINFEIPLDLPTEDKESDIPDTAGRPAN
ncbi:MAG: hypothetical protein JW810_08165 [Sedimentisphaerales bacterium]|nr:hypothetical protein [Sedimentisphaerales bacterium]